MERLKQQIASGERVVRVDLSNQNLCEFPAELFSVKDSVEFINFGNNNLCSLPPNLGEFKHLKTLFFANNQFTEYPEVLKDLPSLFMISFKSNRIERIPEDALSPSIAWLILTDNYIAELPKSIGKLSKLRKVMLSGNQLRSLPDEMQACREIELIRLSANKLESLPTWLLELPKLAWIAYSGNPLETCFRSSAPATTSSELSWSSLVVKEVIGEGASGFVYRGFLDSEEGKEVAIKVYKGAMTSDGNAEDEIKISEAVGDHPSFLAMIGRITGHPEDKPAIVLPLLSPSEYEVLGGPPSFDTVTRDTFPKDMALTAQFVLQVARDICAACVHLHERGIMHGDLYAHNILTTKSGKSLLTDFGAASLRTMHETNIQKLLEKVEVRAFGNLLDDLLNNVKDEENSVLDALRSLVVSCTTDIVLGRPNFRRVAEVLLTL